MDVLSVPRRADIAGGVSDQLTLTDKTISVSLDEGPEMEIAATTLPTYRKLLKLSNSDLQHALLYLRIAQFTRLFQVLQQGGHIHKRVGVNCCKPVCRMMLINSSSAADKAALCPHRKHAAADDCPWRTHPDHRFTL